VILKIQEFANWKLDEHGPFIDDLPILELVIFHSYVELPKGTSTLTIDVVNIEPSRNTVK